MIDLGLDRIRRLGREPAGLAGFRACFARSRGLSEVGSVVVRRALVVGVEQTYTSARWPALRRKDVATETGKNGSDEYWIGYDVAVFRV